VWLGGVQSRTNDVIGIGIVSFGSILVLFWWNPRYTNQSHFSHDLLDNTNGKLTPQNDRKRNLMVESPKAPKGLAGHSAIGDTMVPPSIDLILPSISRQYLAGQFGRVTCMKESSSLLLLARLPATSHLHVFHWNKVNTTLLDFYPKQWN
jgi:hypothetical protein